MNWQKWLKKKRWIRKTETSSMYVTDIYKEKNETVKHLQIKWWKIPWNKDVTLQIARAHCVPGWVCDDQATLLHSLVKIGFCVHPGRKSRAERGNSYLQA